ncbi:hypothetical protein [Bradyrhizobium sp. USDA 336]|uniref:hypothetical protein n=1 Tax=Bradyrhizobium sp. USDA 336 TaxID=3156311 RepID=UPI00383659E3
MAFCYFSESALTVGQNSAIVPISQAPDVDAHGLSPPLRDEQTDLAIQTIVSMRGCITQRISGALAATSTPPRFALPSQRAFYSLLSQVVALPAPGDAEEINGGLRPAVYWQGRGDDPERHNSESHNPESHLTAAS